MPSFASASSVTGTGISLYQPGSGTPVSQVVAGSAGGLLVSFTVSTQTDPGDAVVLTAPEGGLFNSALSDSNVNFMTNATVDPSSYSSSQVVGITNGGRTISMQVPNSISVAPGQQLVLRLTMYQQLITFGTVAGPNTMEVHTSKDVDPVNTPSFTIVPGAPDSVVALDGTQRGVHDQNFDPMHVGVEDEFGNLIPNQEVTATVPASGASGIFPGSQSSATVDTGSSGSGLLPIVKANGVLGEWDLALEGPGGLESSYEMTNLAHGDPDSVDVTLTPSSVPADGSSKTTAVATVTDQFGNPIPDEDVSFSSDGGQQIGAVTDNGDGTYEAQLTASTTSGASTITATDNSPHGDASGSATLTQTPLPASTIKLVLTPSSVPADGKSTVTGQAVVHDALGNAVTGAQIKFTSTGGQKIAAVKNAGQGVYTVAITSSKTAGASTITASVVGASPALSAKATLTQTKAAVVKPVLRFLKPPRKTVRTAKVKFRFKAVKGKAVSFQCRLDKKKWTRCKSPKVVKIKRGRHVFSVRGVATDGSYGKPIKRRIKRV
ncbi:MAG: Ig-like domain-containing protein [Solirubrobacterales bacterium]|nr:Ig-like domain-containing protein [Solirubrobacterales bacterium]